MFNMEWSIKHNRTNFVTDCSAKFSHKIDYNKQSTVKQMKTRDDDICISNTYNNNKQMETVERLFETGFTDLQSQRIRRFRLGFNFQ
jgi:hypothetical protein